MPSASRKGAPLDAQEALVARHQAELEAIAKEYVGKVEAVQKERDSAIAGIRTKASHALVALVAGFEKERSAALARFALQCERARASERQPQDIEPVSPPKRRTGAN